MAEAQVTAMSGYREITKNNYRIFIYWPIAKNETPKKA